MAKHDEPRESSPFEGVQRLTPVDVQQKQFRLAFRGYNEREVDEFLDQVTEELARLHAENRRWQEELEARRTVPMAIGGAGETEQVLARAKQQAAQILAEAEDQARALLADARRTSEYVGSSVAGTELGSSDTRAGDFLGREKDFLQRLAGLIQEHAEAVKQDLRAIREAAAAPEAGAVRETGSFGGEAESEVMEAGVLEPEARLPETDWTPATPEVEVVESAEPLEGDGSPPGEPRAVAEVEPEPQAEAVPETDGGPEPEEPEPWAGPVSREMEFDSTTEPESEPGPSWGPPAESTQWDEPAEESLQAEEFLFEQPTLAGEPPPPSGSPDEPEPGEPQDFDRGTGEDDGDEGEDRSLRELFWGED
jgi:cell division initiation protein